jgi:hypothetical protein
MAFQGAPKAPHPAVPIASSLLYPSHHPNARLCDFEHTASGFWIVDLRRHRTCSSCD